MDMNAFVEYVCYQIFYFLAYLIIFLMMYFIYWLENFSSY